MNHSEAGRKRGDVVYSRLKSPMGNPQTGDWLQLQKFSPSCLNLTSDSPAQGSCNRKTSPQNTWLWMRPGLSLSRAIGLCEIVKWNGLVAQMCPALCDPMNYAPQAPLSMEFSGEEVDCTLNWLTKSCICTRTQGGSINLKRAWTQPPDDLGEPPREEGGNRNSPRSHNTGGSHYGELVQSQGYWTGKCHSEIIPQGPAPSTSLWLQYWDTSAQTTTQEGTQPTP